MKNLLEKLQPVDLIACVVLIGAFFLKGIGLDGTVSMVITAVVLFYFGEKKLADKKKEQILPAAKSETIEQIVIRVAKEMGVDWHLAVRVAKCESGLNPSAVNINTSGSKDRGLFQWNDKWHPEINDRIAFDAELSTRAFCEAFKSGNIRWWNATRKCWEV